MEAARQRLDSSAARAASELAAGGVPMDTLTSTKLVTVSRRSGFLGLSKTQVEETRTQSTTPGWRLLEEPFEALTEYKMHQGQRSGLLEAIETRESLWLTPRGEIHVYLVTSSALHPRGGPPRMSTTVGGRSCVSGAMKSGRASDQDLRRYDFARREVVRDDRPSEPVRESWWTTGDAQLWEPFERIRSAIAELLTRGRRT